LLSAFVVILISGLRWKTGTDWNPYFNLFNDNQSWGDFFSVAYEHGYLFLNALVKQFTDDYTVLLFTIVIIVVGLKYSAISILSPYPLIAILINVSFYAGDMFNVRQGIAIAIVVFSAVFIVRKQFKSFLICVFIASSFHITAISFIFAYKLFYMKMDNSKIIAYLLLSFLSSLILNVGDLLLIVSDYIFPFISDKIGRYVVMDIHVASDIPLWLRQVLGFTKRFFIVLILLYLSTKIRDEKFKGFFNLFIVSVFLYIFLNDVHPVFKRLAMYYSFFEVILLSYIIIPFKGSSKFLILLLIIVYSYSKYIYGFQSNWNLFFPYENIFNNSFKYVY